MIVIVTVSFPCSSPSFLPSERYAFSGLPDYFRSICETLLFHVAVDFFQQIFFGIERLMMLIENLLRLVCYRYKDLLKMQWIFNNIFCHKHHGPNVWMVICINQRIYRQLNLTNRCACIRVNTRNLGKYSFYLVSFSAGSCSETLSSTLFLKQLRKSGLEYPCPFGSFSAFSHHSAWNDSCSGDTATYPLQTSHVHSFVYMNLFGDAIHNLIDGLIIGGSYLVSIPIG